MNDKNVEYIKIRIAIALRVLHNRNKENYKVKPDSKDDVRSYEKIALNSAIDIRKATITSAFDGNTRSAMTTIISIIESMGYTLSEFVHEYDNVTNEQIHSFKKEPKKKSDQK